MGTDLGQLGGLVSVAKGKVGERPAALGRGNELDHRLGSGPAYLELRVALEGTTAPVASGDGRGGLLAGLEPCKGLQTLFKSEHETSVDGLRVELALVGKERSRVNGHQLGGAAPVDIERGLVPARERGGLKRGGLTGGRRPT